MRNLTLTCLLCIACWQSSDAQYFNRTYILGAGNNLLTSLQIQRDTVYAISQVFDSSTTNDLMEVAKLDKHGNVISQTLFSIPSKNVVAGTDNSLIKTNDGGFAYAGWTRDTSVYPLSGMLVKYDQFGAVQFYKQYIDTPCDLFYATAMTQDVYSNYYITGYLGRQDPFTHSYINSRMFLIKTDSMGNKIFFKEIMETGYNNTATGICINRKGNIVMGGGSDNAVNISDFSYFKIIRKIYEFDTAGTVLNYKWSTGADTVGPYVGPMLATSDGGYLTANVRKVNGFPTYWQAKCSIAKLDSNFNIVWKIDTGLVSESSRFVALVRSPDGNYIASGLSYDEADTFNGHENGRLMKFTENGEILWDRLYRGVTSSSRFGNEVNKIKTLSFLSNGDIIAGGEAINHDLQFNFQKSWLMRLDSMGCLRDSADCGVVVDGIENIVYSKMQVSLYPNPATQYFHLDILNSDFIAPLTFTLSDLLGQSILSKEISSPQTEIPRSAITSGFYTWQLLDHNGQIKATGKLVWE